MSQNQKKQNNNKIVKSRKEVSIYDDLSEIDVADKSETSISINHNGEIIGGDTKLPLHNRLFANAFSDNEITVVNRKRTKGYAPTVFAIILFSGLLFINIYCQVKLDTVSNDMTSMRSQLETLKENEKEYSLKLAQKDKEVLEEYAEYVEGELGMVKEDPNKVYVEMKLEDETTVIEKVETTNGWTTLLSSMGRFFSDIFG